MSVDEYDAANGRHIVVVRAPVSDYVIEPIRHDLGLSRVEMVDEHLAGRSDGVWRTSEDTNALLDARSAFAGETS